MKPVVSVIVPVYNVEKYVGKCIDSILKQSYSNLQVILVNDGSTDGSLNVIEKYTDDTRCEIINKKNGGLSSARNAGLRIANGQYVLFVDSDDWLDRECVETLLHKMECTHADYCCYRFSYMSYNGKTLKVREKYSSPSLDDNDEIIKRVLLGKGIPTTAWSKFFRRDFLINNNLFFKEGIINEDYVFSIDCAIVAKSIIFCNSILYFVLERETSISRNMKMSNFTMPSIIYQNTKNVFEQHNLYTRYSDYIDAGYCKQTLYTLVQAAFRLRYKSFIEFYQVLDNTSYKQKTIGHNIQLYSKEVYYLYLLSFNPSLFFFAMRALKILGFHMP